jgi:hypothetical protein
MAGGTVLDGHGYHYPGAEPQAQAQQALTRCFLRCFGQIRAKCWTFFLSKEIGKQYFRVTDK